MSAHPLLDHDESMFEKGIGCWFAIVAILAIILVLAALVGLVAAIDLAYKNWG